MSEFSAILVLHRGSLGLLLFSLTIVGYIIIFLIVLYSKFKLLLLSSDNFCEVILFFRIFITFIVFFVLIAKEKTNIEISEIPHSAAVRFFSQCQLQLPLQVYRHSNQVCLVNPFSQIPFIIHYQISCIYFKTIFSWWGSENII